MSDGPVNVTAISDPVARSAQFADVYHSALGTLPDAPDRAAAEEWVSSTLPRHVTRDAFRCFGALEDGRLVGFIYGYHGEHGQFWEEWLADRIAPELFTKWIGDHFALVEFHVDAAHHGQGIGRQLYAALFAAPLDYRRAVLTTRNGDTPARRFYEHRGWELVCEVTERHSLMGLEL